MKDHSIEHLQNIKNYILNNRRSATKVIIHLNDDVQVGFMEPLRSKVLDLVVKEITDEINRRLNDD